MSSKLKDFFLRWLKNILGFALAARLFSGIHYHTWADLGLATILLSMLHTFVRPLLKELLRTVIFATLGLFSLVINGTMLYLVGRGLAPDFVVDTFWTAFRAAILISIVSGIVFVFEKIFFGVKVIQTFNQPAPPPPPRSPQGPPAGTGPIIDV